MNANTMEKQGKDDGLEIAKRMAEEEEGVGRRPSTAISGVPLESPERPPR